MSDKTRPVIRITSVLPHENADSLEVIPVGGYTVCARLGQFHVGDLAVYLEPDDLLPKTAMRTSRRSDCVACYPTACSSPLALDG
jgi:hypothetical protein